MLQPGIPLRPPATTRCPPRSANPPGNIIIIIIQMYETQCHTAPCRAQMAGTHGVQDSSSATTRSSQLRTACSHLRGDLTQNQKQICQLRCFFGTFHSKQASIVLEADMAHTNPFRRPWTWRRPLQTRRCRAASRRSGVVARQKRPGQRNTYVLIIT